MATVVVRVQRFFVLTILILVVGSCWYPKASHQYERQAEDRFVLHSQLEPNHHGEDHVLLPCIEAHAISVLSAVAYLSGIHDMFIL